METLQISKENALKAFDEANDKGKTLLSNLFGQQVFSKKITDRVKSFEDACQVLGIDPDEVLPCVSSDDLHKDAASISAYCQLIIIAKALNEGWKPDWENQNEYKYYPWFKMKAGFGFSFTFFDCWDTYSTVGSRLCFKSQELAEYAGKQFEEIYNQFLNN